VPSTAEVAYGRRSFVRVRGAATGRVYEFSGTRAVQTVAAADVAGLVRTGLFRPTR
jgi:hypothetical protein